MTINAPQTPRALRTPWYMLLGFPSRCHTGPCQTRAKQFHNTCSVCTHARCTVKRSYLEEVCWLAVQWQRVIKLVRAVILAALGGVTQCVVCLLYLQGTSQGERAASTTRQYEIFISDGRKWGPWLGQPALRSTQAAGMSTHSQPHAAEPLWACVALAPTMLTPCTNHA